jgi:hypothetical protein
MDIKQRIVKDFLAEFSYSQYHDFIDEARYKLQEFKTYRDKIDFLNGILESVNQEYNRHKHQCHEPEEECLYYIGKEHINFYLHQELHELGVIINQDLFTPEEKEDFSEKLNIVLSELQNLEAAQKFVYEEVMVELEELKRLFFVGKKNWKQLLVGKSVDMIAGGIISETISKKIIEKFVDNVPGIIDHISPPGLHQNT